MIYKLDLWLGQGSGSSQTRFQRRPLSINRSSQSMPRRNTLTFRFGFCQLLRCWGASDVGGVRRLPGAMRRSWASSTLVP